MRPLTREESRAVDRDAQVRLHLPGDLLMENAGRALADVVAATLERHGRRRAVVVAGPGNNGGDGFVAARHLLDRADDVVVLLCGAADRLSGDAAANHRRWTALDGRTIEATDAAPVRTALASPPPPVVVDAVFGTGLDRPVEGFRREILEAIDAAGHPVVAADLPSGLDADTGEVLGAAVHAETTVTFVAEKVGFARGAGPEYVGEVVVAGIGFPRREEAGESKGEQREQGRGR